MDPFQGCTNPWRQVAMTTKLRTAVPSIFGYSVRNLLQVTLLVPRTLRWVVYFWKIRAPLDSRRVPHGCETLPVSLVTVRTGIRCSRRLYWEDILNLEGGSNRRSVLCCDFSQRSVVDSYRRFGTTDLFHLQGSSIPGRIPGCCHRYGTTALRCEGQIYWHRDTSLIPSK